jgi:hypothetical protein
MLGFIQSFLFLVDLLNHNITLTDSVSWNQRALEARSVMDFKVYDFFGGQSSQFPIINHDSKITYYLQGKVSFGLILQLAMWTHIYWYFPMLI